ncbi:MAG TPA: Ig-like domain-containing protein [Solirubrobacteraceae bacterium]
MPELLSPRILRRLLPVVLALSAILPVAVAQAAPTPGVNLAGIPNDAEIDAAAATGARTARMFVLWADVERTRGSYDSGLLRRYDEVLNRLSSHGMKAVFVVTSAPGWASGSSNPHTPPLPQYAADYAAFGRTVAARFAGKVAAYEIWNEEDEAQFWSTGADAARYAALVKTAYPAFKAGDPAAKVLLGPLTGNNYAFLEQLYAQGVKGSFDGVAVHTDTACLDRGPDSFYKDGGRIARFAFLGYREVRATMLANGDDKPLWMTELGWSTTTRTCDRGAWAGQKPAGVSEADQARHLKLAFHCMAQDPYVEGALWFTHNDASSTDEELSRYGLRRADGSHKPAWDAFRAIATSGDQLTGPCADLAGPSITVKSPTPRLRFAEQLVIEATATDPAGVARVTFRADGKEIRNFTGGDVASGRPVRLEWMGSNKLALGRHTITVEALDPAGNTSQSTVEVERVDPSQLGATLPTKIAAKVKLGKGRRATLRGRVSKTGDLGLAGKVRVQWQWTKGGKKMRAARARKASWKTIHGGLKPANKPFNFTQKLKRKGNWRVRVIAQVKAPYKSSTSAWVYFYAKR